MKDSISAAFGAQIGADFGAEFDAALASKLFFSVLGVSGVGEPPPGNLCGGSGGGLPPQEIWAVLG